MPSSLWAYCFSRVWVFYILNYVLSENVRPIVKINEHSCGRQNSDDFAAKRGLKINETKREQGNNCQGELLTKVCTYF